MTTTNQTHPHTRHPGAGPRIHPCWCCSIDVLTTLMPVLCSETCRTAWIAQYRIAIDSDQPAALPDDEWVDLEKLPAHPVDDLVDWLAENRPSTPSAQPHRQWSGPRVWKMGDRARWLFAETETVVDVLDVLPSAPHTQTLWVSDGDIDFEVDSTELDPTPLPTRPTRWQRLRDYIRRWPA